MVRPATFIDIPFLLNLGNRYCEEEVKKIKYHSANWNVDMCANAFCMSVNDDDDFLWLGVNDGEIVGFLWATTHMMAPWNPDKVASDYIFYVVPEKRGTMIGHSLIKAYKSWAESKGCLEVRLSIASGINEERIGKMYERLGFEPFGSVYNHKVRSNHGCSKESI